MAVISELIDVGLQLKSQGKQEAAVEHFLQLHETYPGNARVKFELAATWGAFGVPEQALPLYRELLALPKRKGLPAKDMPRLYARLAASLYSLHEYDEAMAIVEEGLRLHPSYRPLRAYRIFNQNAAGKTGIALVDALDLMLESLAPSRWDIFEDDVKRIFNEMRQAVTDANQWHDGNLTDGRQVAADEKAATHDDAAAIVQAEAVEKKSDGRDPGSGDPAVKNKIAVNPAPDEIEDFELEVKVKSEARKSDKKQSKTRVGKQHRESKVRINISGSEDGGEVEAEPGDDVDETGSAKVNIPIDFD